MCFIQFITYSLKFIIIYVFIRNLILVKNNSFLCYVFPYIFLPYFHLTDMEIIRNYTPVVSSLDVNEASDFSDGKHIVLMIKIYPSGTLTPVINMCSIGICSFNYAELCNFLF